MAASGSLPNLSDSNVFLKLDFYEFKSDQQLNSPHNQVTKVIKAVTKLNALVLVKVMGI